ncbi:NUDIX domain-containing protein [Streptomyces sp. NPDC001634]|uniref:NUDIX domain-containing protein n=1 Tax=Streptomyces sp. NPDC001634 TaxID=3154390 RepID=UPI00332B2F9A
MEDGEDHTTATLRELREELGIDGTAVELGEHLAERSKDHLVGGREVRQVERYFLTRVSAAAVGPTRATQADNIREHRWWTFPELRATQDTVYPAGLADLVAAVTEGRTPKRPVVLTCGRLTPSAKRTSASRGSTSTRKAEPPSSPA